MLPWSAYRAMLDMWRELDKDVTNGEMQQFFQRHLQEAYDAGKREQREETAKATKQISDALEQMRGVATARRSAT